MDNYNVPGESLTNIANAIREKKGISENLTFPEGFISAIGSIPTSETVLVSKTIAENGTYNPSNDNADGYSLVQVNVPQSSSPLTKIGVYTVQEDWTQTGYSILQTVLDGYLDSNAFLYVLIFNNNASTSSYRVDMMACLTNTTEIASLTSSSGAAWKNYYGSIGTLGSSMKADQGTVIDIYRADHS